MAHPHVVVLPATTPSSYAKIVAMPAPNFSSRKQNTSHSVTRTSSGSSDRPQILAEHGPEIEQGIHKSMADRASQPADSDTSASLQKLSLSGVRIEAVQAEHNGDSTDSYGEDQSQISGSSGNKPQSFDTKSMASVTTFAMDDKESIRPDDSASVQAVDDETPHPMLSRNSSFQHDHEPAHRTSRIFPSNVTIPGRRFPGLANPPRFGNLPISPVLESQDVQMPQPPVQVLSLDDPRDPATVVVNSPDTKLMDALASAKDRLPLLQLEEKLLAFIRLGTGEILDLPPQNAFTRLLTHKLADYYNMAHLVTEDNTSVRIFRSSPRMLPIPLTELAKAVTLGSSSIPSSSAVKIMRREQLGRHFSAGNSTAPSSSVPSKATSENGVEGPSDDGLTSPSESTPSRDKSKMSREERETQYKLARDRIFADFQESMTSETNSNEEYSASMSRSSSSSGKKKTRRHKQPKDDSFEARSAYVASYTPAQTQYAPQYIDAAATSNGFPGVPADYAQSMYGVTPAQSFNGFDHSMQYSQIQGYQPLQQFNPNDWQAVQAIQMQNAYMMYPQAMQFPPATNMMMPGMQPMQTQIPEWYSHQGQNIMTHGLSGPPSSFSQHAGLDARSPVQDEQFAARAYFAPSTSGNHYGHKAQKSLFNPQTRSFVPNSTDGRSAYRSGRSKNPSRHSMHSNPNQQSHNNGSACGSKEDSLKQRYGTPASLPKKPPPQGARQVPDYVNAALSQR